MKYEEFKTILLERLQNHYGKEAVIEAEKVMRNNGQSYNGLRIAKKASDKTTPVINLDEIYEDYCARIMDMEACVEEICRVREENECTEEMQKIADKLKEWEFAKDNVYPILLSTKENHALLQGLVSTPMLDLSVAYIIRCRLSGKSEGGIKVNREMLALYGIDKKKLHKRAMKNMKKEGYQFHPIEYHVRNLLNIMGFEGKAFPKKMDDVEMYVLTNQKNQYGAAGILDKELVKKFAKGRDFFILPSSVHETIFVPASDRSKNMEFDQMVAGINKKVVAKEEWLSDHCYYYDASDDEIRISN